MKEIKSVNILSGGGGSPEPVPYLVPSDWTTKNIRVKAEPVANVTLGLRLALNATARACGQKRGLARRALDSTQGKPCSVALLGLAFTMAEILLSLTIIGVVAAITLPSLTGNINERTWNTQRKALYARFSQAVSLMDSMNGYADAETFVTAGLSKVLKINNVCDYDHLEDCGITSKQITDNAGNPTSMPKLVSELNPKNTSMSFTDTHGTTPVDYSYSNVDTEAAAFETQNGESILAFYNPSCSADMQETDYYGASKVCANFVYDLNGSKGPNAVGKDIGVMTVLYPSDSLVVAPMLYPRNSGVEVDFNEAPKACTALDAEYRVPNIGEVISMFYNSKLLNIESSHYWSSSRYDSSKAWNMSGTTGRIFLEPISSTGWKKVKCVKR